MEPYTPPTYEEIERVAAHWARIEKLVCNHKMVTFSVEGRMSCAECEEPVHILSDIQIDEKVRLRKLMQ